MTDLYFTCEWVIRPAINYVRLFDMTREMGCELAVVQANVVTPEKLVLMRFALRAESHAAFATFVEKVGAATGLTDWQPATADTFGRGQILDLSLVDSDFVARWMDGMHAYGVHNAGLLAEKERHDADD